jgi:hypothetical protein
MYYGINYMGSYASQTSTEERWQIAHHVDALTKDLKGQPRQEFVTVLVEGIALENSNVDKKKGADENHSDQKEGAHHSIENETTTEGH